MLFTLLFLAVSCFSLEMGLVVDRVEEVNTMREGLVHSLKKPIGVTDFAQTCKQVGKRAKNIAKKNNWVFRQASHKYRNPINKAKGLESKAVKIFQKDKKLLSFWMEKNGEKHYFRRIDIKAKCLLCHGAKSGRPEFIQKKYPKDKAFNFKLGDLRGLYHISDK